MERIIVLRFRLAQSLGAISNLRSILKETSIFSHSLNLPIVGDVRERAIRVRYQLLGETVADVLGAFGAKDVAIGDSGYYLYIDRRMTLQCKLDNTDLEKPCELCKKRGFHCGVEDKVWGPEKQKKLMECGSLGDLPGQSTFAIIRGPAIPDHLVIIDVETDFRYHQFYEVSYYEKRWSDISSTSSFLDQVFISFKFGCRLDVDFNSPVLRAALLAFACCL